MRNPPSCPVPQPRLQPDLRGPLRTAWEAEDWMAVRAALLADTQAVHGCHLWTRQADRSGYAKVNIGKQTFSAHRVMASAIAGHRLDAKQPVHHTCATRRCINPDHLQVVTAQDNLAEMLHRRWYEDRIRELEAALSSVAPHHPALVGLPLGLTSEGVGGEPKAA